MEEQDDLITKNHKIKLKACLGSFLKEFTSKSIENKNLIAEVSVVLIDLTLSSNQCAKEIARTAYYFTYGTADQRQFIISDILDKINLKLRNQNVTEKWIEILVIFDLNQPSDGWFNGKIKFCLNFFFYFRQVTRTILL